MRQVRWEKRETSVYRPREAVVIEEKVISHCAARREKRQKVETYEQFQERCRCNKAAGKKQRLCDLCGRWCWPEDRCAAFTGKYKTAETNCDMPAVKAIRQATERQARALELRRSGLSFQQIGDRLGGVTRQRAQQLVNAGEKIERLLTTTKELESA